MNLNDAIKPELHRQWLVLFKKLNKLLRFLFKVKLSNPSEARFEVLEVHCAMRKAKVKLSWTPSTAGDIISQKIKVVDPDDGQVFLDKTVTPEITEVTVDELVNEKQKLQGVVIATDGLNESEPLVVDFVVPDLTKPPAPTDGAFSYEVVDEDTDSQD